MKISMLPARFLTGSGNRWKEVCKNKPSDLEVFLRLLRIVGTQGESMRAISKTILAVALLVIGGFFATSVSATTIRSASTYGQDPGFQSCLASTDPCESFNLQSQGTVILDGILGFNVDQFAFNDGTPLGSPVTQTVDIFNLGSIAPGQTFTLSSSLFSAADLANAQILGCNDGSTFPVDSSSPPQPVNGFCTQINGTAYNGLISNGVVNGLASFSTTADYNLSNLVLDVPLSATPTPEPASLMLLGTGLTVLVGSKVRGRKRA